MRVPCIITTTLTLLVACGHGDPDKAIIQIAKRDSAMYCSERSKEGCEFSIVKTRDGWGVMAHPIVRSDNRQRAYVPGLWRSYSYDNQGKLLREMPGL